MGLPLLVSDLAPSHVGAYLTIEPCKGYPQGMPEPLHVLHVERRGSYMRVVTRGRRDDGTPYRRVDIVHGTCCCTVWEL